MRRARFFASLDMWHPFYALSSEGGCPPNRVNPSRCPKCSSEVCFVHGIGPHHRPSRIDELSVEEKLDYLEALWARVVSKPEQIPVPDWHRKILAERLAAYRAGKGTSRPWSEFRDEMRSLLRAPTR